MKKARVGVLMGGLSAEREVSLRSGRAVADALRALGHSVTELDIVEPLDVLRAVDEHSIELAFVAMHGRFGEDGCVQGLLEILGVPYTGSSVLASALAMDKLKSKELFRLFNVPTPPYYVIDGPRALANLKELHGSFGYPVVVKPRREGSSLGLGKANNLAELEQAVRHALDFDSSLLVERFISGREVHVGLLEGRVLGAIEVAPQGELYDFHAKYNSDLTHYYMPARLPGARYRGVLNLAERAAQALEVTGAARVDLLVTEGQNEYVLEVNTLPGMTPTSLLPKIAAASGYDFAGLCEAILASARLFTGSTTTPAQHTDALELEEAAFEEGDMVVARSARRKASVRRAS